MVTLKNSNASVHAFVLALGYVAALLAGFSVAL